MDELVSVVFWTFEVNGITQHEMINSQTSSQINGQISSQINIKIAEIQDISSILDRVMFHHSQQEDKVMHHRVHRRRHQQHLLRATWS